MVSKPTIYDKAQEDLHAVDVYRDTAVRFFGYANEVGEAFRAWVPINIVRLSYVVAMGYVFSDTADKSRKTYQLNYLNSKERSQAVAFRAIDTLIWQSLASVVIPGIMINRVCYLSTKLLSWSTRWPLKVQKLTSTILGLCAIPFIVKPIDTAVEIGMQSSLRKFYSAEIFEK